ncbi:MAG: family 78 glycoside hydrolase catalytic domain, partial [Chryseolinea sp.]
DANKEQPGWDTPSFNDVRWHAALAVAAPSALIVSQQLQPVRAIEEIKPKNLVKLSNKKYVFDLGRNIAGICRITVSGSKGTHLRLKHAEVLDGTGNVNMSNIDVHYRPTDDTDPFQTDIFILSGKKNETFSPRFNYKGFQYVEVTSDQPVSLTRESLTGISLHSDVTSVGSITSSNDMINKLWQATNNSYLANLFGYPTDCPQREKNGWTGDAHIASETGLYNFDGITIYEKWLADHRDEQQPDGVLPSIIPTAGWGYEWGNGPDWTSTIAIIPWNVYLFYGDKKLLADCYDNIKRYVDHIAEKNPNGLTDWGLGDWVPVKSVTPKELTSSLYYYADASILARAAKILDKADDAEKYNLLSKKIAQAINDKYLHKDTGLYGTGLQTELSAPLFWGIVPDEIKSKVVANLVKRVHEDDDHIDVGLLGTKTILNALSENGHADLAYKVAAQETFPSWGYWIKNGATTLFENWPIDAKSDISRNHIMFGEIGAWLYKSPGGLKPDPDQPGFKHILLQPHFVEGLDYFTAKHTSPYGEIVSSWRRVDKKIYYTTIVPPNSTATLELNAKSVEELSKNNAITSNDGEHTTIQLASGKHVFEIVF